MLFAKADFSLDKIMVRPLLQASPFADFISIGVETGVILSKFSQQLCRKNADNHVAPLEAAVVSPTLVVSQTYKAKERGSWVPLKALTSKAAEIVHTGRLCSWVCAGIRESYQSIIIKGETFCAFKSF